MKWRDKRQGQRWYQRPDEGYRVYYAKKAGVTYTVQAAWRDTFKRSGAVIWWMHHGNGTNLSFATKDEAIQKAEALATRRRLRRVG